MSANRAICLVTAALTLLVSGARVSAQAPAQKPGAPAAAAPAAPPAAAAAAPDASAPASGTPEAPAAPGAAAPGTAPPAEAYSYNPEGRRDPFVSLLVRGGERSAKDVRPTGREGLLIAEVTLRGIVKNGAAYMAMLQGADNKTYIVHAGDKMLDGVVKMISADAIVFAQDVNDPLSLVKEREVRKALRLTEEGK
jgi:Tfp pilus assembly protein PilP